MSNEETKEQEGTVEETTQTPGILETAAEAVGNVVGSVEAAAETASETVSSAVESAGEAVDSVTQRVSDATASVTQLFASRKEGAAASDADRNERKTRIGLVTSNKMDKTIAVEIQRRLQHPIYGKYVKKSKKLIAHDETNQCQIGDLVKIMETRPLSRRKRWRLVEVIEKAK